MDFVDVISRWVHIGAAVTLLGGTVFSRFVLLPAAATLPDAEHEKLRAGVLSRWKWFVHIGILLLVSSGFYNYVRGLQTHVALKKQYHAFVDTKILLAFVVFFLAEALVGRSSLAVSLRKNAKLWLGLLVLLGAIIVAISGYVKVKLPPQPGANAAAVE